LKGQPTRTIRPLLLEGVVIVASIVFAFALDAGWDDLAKDRQLRQQLGSVQGEVLGNRDRILFQVDLMERMIVAGESLVEAIDSAASEGGVVSVPDTIAWLPLNTPTLDASLGAIDALVGSGQLALIRDPALRSLLAGLRDRIEDAVEEQTQAMMVYHDHLFPRLIDAGYRAPPVVGQSLVDYWAERVPGRPARSFGEVEFPTRPDLAEPILERLRLYTVCIGEMRELLAVLDNLEQAVAAIR
jgi:hypothetical protein